MKKLLSILCLSIVITSFSSCVCQCVTCPGYDICKSQSNYANATDAQWEQAFKDSGCTCK